MKKTALYILFQFFTVVAYGQVNLAISEVKDQRVNQKFILTVILEIKGENMEQETPLRMPDLSKFDIIATGSEQNTVVLDPKKGDILNQIIYQCVLSPRQAGKIKVGSVLVTVNNKMYKTEPFEINVRESEKKTSLAEVPSGSDVYLTLEVEDHEVYRNQPQVAVLKAHSRDYGNFRKVKNIRLPHQKNVKITKVSAAKSDIETNAGMASQILGTYMVFPSEAGRIELAPFSASFTSPHKEKKINSNRVSLNVKKLPSGMPQDYKNAVGKFAVSATKNNLKEVPELDKPVNISLKVSGSGNLTSLHLPKIVSSESYTSFPPKVSYATSMSADGMSGDVVADYVVIPKKTGPVTVGFESFSYFNPDEKEFVDLGSKSVVLHVKTYEQIADSKSAMEKVNEYTNNVLETVNTPILQTHNLKIPDQSKINWKIVAGNLGLIASLLSLFLVVRKKVKKKKQESTSVKAPITTIAETEDLIRRKFSDDNHDYIEYLKKLTQNKDYTKFFTIYEELKNETLRMFKLSSETEFRAWLEANKGHSLADQYRALSEQIQIQKYSPYQSDEHLEELMKSIERLYSEIRK